MQKLISLGILLFLIACAVPEEMVKPQKVEKATFAGGCFWCIESDFEKVDGVLKAISGFSGGTEKSPTYKQVSAGSTGHTESVQITFDPAIVSYEELVDIFWKHHDPTDNEGQFADRGKQYRPAIFYHDDKQKEIVQRTKKALEESGKFDTPIVTEIIKLTEFYLAEEYHQDYYKKHPIKYKFYRRGSGRDQFLREVWG